MQDEDVWDGLWGEVYRNITMFDDDTDALNQQRDNVPFAPITDNSGSSLLRTKDATMESLFQYVNEMDPALNTIRSPSVANLPYNRLANMATTRSSVFAIWVTMAYFEVDADGKIGAEIGTDPTDLADQVRYRGFWIYDRSIPVAFEPGSIITWIAESLFSRSLKSKEPRMIKLKQTKASGFTLIEVLIGLLMTLIVLGAMLSTFFYASKEMAKGRASVSLSKQLTVVEDLLRRDLERLTLPPRVWMQTAEAPGYFEYWEGGGSDSVPIAPGR